MLPSAVTVAQDSPLHDHSLYTESREHSLIEVHVFRTPYRKVSQSLVPVVHHLAKSTSFPFC